DHPARGHASSTRRATPALYTLSLHDALPIFEVAFFNHALHENRADHTAPADKTNIFHSVFFLRRCVLCMLTSVPLVYPSPYKKQPKSQVKLINDSEAISNATYPAAQASRKSTAIITEFEL